MPYPFQGMDPFIEDDNWPGFHLLLCGELIRQLNRQLPEGYVCRGEVNFGISVGWGEDARVRPYVAVQGFAGTTGALTMPEYSPATTTSVLSDTAEAHRFVQVIEQATRRVVAVIEVISPTNKIGDGLVQYLRKRRHYIQSGINLLEIDLLRQGRRRYEQLLQQPASTYGVFTYDALAATCRYWAVDLAGRLPVVPLRLDGEQVVTVDVQATVMGAWLDGGYSRGIGAYRVGGLSGRLTTGEKGYLADVLDY